MRNDLGCNILIYEVVTCSMANCDDLFLFDLSARQSLLTAGQPIWRADFRVQHCIDTLQFAIAINSCVSL